MDHFSSVYISELLPEPDLSDILHQFPVGLELIQFSISDSLDRFDETLKDVRRMLDRLGNPQTTVHGPFLDLNPMSYDSRIRSATMDRFKTAREGALAIGAKKIIFHSGMIPSVYYLEGWAERMCVFWNEFLSDNAGITVCMENVLDQEFFPIAEIMHTITHPDFELCLDIGHAHCYSLHPAEDWALSLKDGIGHLHLHDNHGVKDEHLALNDGSVPWKKILDILISDANDHKEQPSLSCTLECFRKEDIVKSLSLLDAYLKQSS